MAETFKNQVDALTGFAGTEDDALTDWLTAGAKELINIFPNNLKEKCTAETTLNHSSTTMDMDGVGEILYVNRLSADSGGSRIPCRKVSSMYGELSNDANSIYKASATDPVYWILSSGDAAILNVIPAPTEDQTAVVYHIGYPAVAHSDGASGIANFPDEAEYLVVLYASVKALQRLMNNLNSNSDINTALTYAKAGLDQAETALDKFEAADGDSVFGDEATFLTADSQLAHVSDALIKAQNLIDGATMGGDTEPQSAQYWLDDEDTEMVQATLQTAQAEIQRAQTEIQHWNSIGDMRVKEVQAALSEAQGYIGEVNVRMQRDNQKYQWYQGQQAKLQQDYDRGMQILLDPQPQPQQAGR